MESKIDDLRDEIESVKSEKCRLERQIVTETEVRIILNNLLENASYWWFFFVV